MSAPQINIHPPIVVKGGPNATPWLWAASNVGRQSIKVGMSCRISFVSGATGLCVTSELTTNSRKRRMVAGLCHGSSIVPGGKGFVMKMGVCNSALVHGVMTNRGNWCCLSTTIYGAAKVTTTGGNALAFMVTDQATNTTLPQNIRVMVLPWRV